MSKLLVLSIGGYKHCPISQIEQFNPHLFTFGDHGLQKMNSGLWAVILVFFHVIGNYFHF